MLAAEALQALSKRSPADVRTTTHDQACWLSTGMGIDDPDFVAFLHFFDRSDHYSSKRLARMVSQNISEKTDVVRLIQEGKNWFVSAFYGYNMQSSIEPLQKLRIAYDFPHSADSRHLSSPLS
jgi:hypothetical protein